MEFNSENIGQNPEVPSDQELEGFIQSSKVSGKTIRLIREFLDPNNMYLEKDKIWIARQLRRIIDQQNKGLAQGFRKSFHEDLENRKQTATR